MMLTWRRSTAYSILAGERGEYAVSRSTALDPETGGLADRFSAWYGLDLREQERATARPAQLLGIRGTAAEAKALCEDHLRSSSVPAPGGPSSPPLPAGADTAPVRGADTGAILAPVGAGPSDGLRTGLPAPTR